MELRGWKYEGRKISEKLHRQILEITGILNDTEKSGGRSWRSLQEYMAEELGTKPGQIRTIKRMMEEFGILKKGVLKSSEIPDREQIYTEDGRLLLELLEMEQLMSQCLTEAHRQQMGVLQEIYRLCYQKALISYTCEKGMLHPLKATLKALEEYEYLDYWEWYLLNTVIRRDDDVGQEEELGRLIEEYRAGKLSFGAGAIVENKLSHIYVPGNFAYGGFLLEEGNHLDLRLTLNGEYRELAEKIINER